MVNNSNQNTSKEVSYGKDFKLKFGGPSHEIDVKTLIGVLMSTTDILQEINKELDPEKKLEVKIVALKPGSFLVHIELDLSFIQGLAGFFSKENVEYAAAVMGTLVGIIELHRFLKGDPGKTEPGPGNTLIVTNNSGDIKQVNHPIYNIYISNDKVGPALSKNFAWLDKNPEVTEFEILDSNENALLEIGRPEFEELTKYTVPREKNTNIYVQPAKLRITFDPNHRWVFYWKDKRINATIADPVFNQKVKDGAGRFASGDTLDVELEVTQLYDSSIDSFVNHTYRIVKVSDHTPSPEQQKLF